MNLDSGRLMKPFRKFRVGTPSGTVLADMQEKLEGAMESLADRLNELEDKLDEIRDRLPPEQEEEF